MVNVLNAATNKQEFLRFALKFIALLNRSKKYFCLQNNILIPGKTLTQLSILIPMEEVRLGTI